MAKSQGVSWAPSDATAGTGLFGAGPATAKSHRWGWFNYQGKRKKAAALLVTYVRQGEKHIEAYTCGNGFKPSEDGKTLIPQDGQTGLTDSCKAHRYFAALKDEGMPDDFCDPSDVTVLNGIKGELKVRPLDKIQGNDKAPRLLYFDEITSAPWGKGGKKAKKKDEEEDEEEDDDDDEPKDWAKDEDKEDDDDEDEEEDEKPAKKGKKGKKVKAKADDDEEEEEEEEEEEDESDEDDTEAAGEALIEALEDGPIALKRAEAAVAAKLKGNKRAKAIAALAITPKFLKKELGWSFDGKTIELAN